MLGILEAADLGEDGDHGERDDRTHARDRFESFHRLAPLVRAFAETQVKRTDPLSRLAPYRIVMRHVILEVLGDNAAGEQALPVRIGAQAAARAAGLPDSTQQPLHRVDLSGLDTNEMAPAGQRGAQLADRRTRHVNYRPIKADADLRTTPRRRAYRSSARAGAPCA